MQVQVGVTSFPNPCLAPLLNPPSYNSSALIETPCPVQFAANPSESPMNTSITILSLNFNSLILFFSLDSKLQILSFLVLQLYVVYFEVNCGIDPKQYSKLSITKKFSVKYSPVSRYNCGLLNSKKYLKYGFPTIPTNGISTHPWLNCGTFITISFSSSNLQQFLCPSLFTPFRESISSSKSLQEATNWLQRQRMSEILQRLVLRQLWKVSAMLRQAEEGGPFRILSRMPRRTRSYLERGYQSQCYLEQRSQFLSRSMRSQQLRDWISIWLEVPMRYPLVSYFSLDMIWMLAQRNRGCQVLRSFKGRAYYLSPSMYLSRIVDLRLNTSCPGNNERMLRIPELLEYADCEYTITLLLYSTALNIPSNPVLNFPSKASASIPTCNSFNPTPSQLSSYPPLISSYSPEITEKSDRLLKYFSAIPITFSLYSPNKGTKHRMQMDFWRWDLVSSGFSFLISSVTFTCLKYDIPYTILYSPLTGIMRLKKEQSYILLWEESGIAKGITELKRERVDQVEGCTNQVSAPRLWWNWTTPMAKSGGVISADPSLYPSTMFLRIYAFSSRSSSMMGTLFFWILICSIYDGSMILVQCMILSSNRGAMGWLGYVRQQGEYFSKDSRSMSWLESMRKVSWCFLGVCQVTRSSLSCSMSNYPIFWWMQALPFRKYFFI